MNNDWKIVLKLWKVQVPGWDSHSVSTSKRVFVITKTHKYPIFSGLVVFQTRAVWSLFCIPLIQIQTFPNLWYDCSTPWQTPVPFSGSQESIISRWKFILANFICTPQNTTPAIPLRFHAGQYWLPQMSWTSSVFSLREVPVLNERLLQQSCCPPMLAKWPWC